MRIQDLTTPLYEQDLPHGVKYEGELEEPKVLYRSVSPQELKSFWSMGRISGGGNVFNEFDPRNYVFFADEVSDLLIWQGEDVERQAIHKLKQTYQKPIEELGHQIAELKQREEAGEQVKRQRQQLEKKFQGLLDHYRREVRGAEAAMRSEQADKPFTSAILQTKPITGGKIFTGAWQGAEYGFEPNEITHQDIDKIHLVRDKKIIDTIPMAQFDDYMWNLTSSS